MAVELKTPSLVIEMVDPKLLKPHPEAEQVPMSKEDEEALKADIKNNGVMHALDVTSNLVILDGIHRQRFAIELGISAIPIMKYHYDEHEEESIHAIRANLKRRHLNEGQRAGLALKILPYEEALARKRQSQGAKELQSIQERNESGKFLPKETGLVATATNPVGQSIPESEKAQLALSQLSSLKNKAKKNSKDGKAAKKAGETVGVSADTVYKAKKLKEDAPALFDSMLKGEVSVTKAYKQVKAEEKAEEVKQAIESGRQLTDLEIMQRLGIPVQPYDVWNFPTCDDRFGSDYPGRIPGQLVAHCLYFWTEQGDLVLDPMGGSGTTIDVCKALNRRALAYDAHPSREDITLHNLATQGWPEATKDAKLIFWDPPYFKKKDDGYGEQSISRFDRSEYLAFFDQMATTIPDEFQGRMAFLMSDYNDEENLQECIWFTDYVNIFTRRNWQIERFIYPPLTTQSVHPDIMQKFRASKRLARLGRVLVVMSR